MTAEIDAVGIVDDAIEDGIGVGGIADEFMPFVDGNLAGDDGGSSAISFFEYLKEIVTGRGIEGLQAPIVEYQQLDTAERSQDAGIATIAARQS
jgi:hypothetical protein